MNNTKAFSIVGSIIIVAILLTDIDDAKFSCKNKQLAYVKITDYVVEYIVKSESKNGEFYIPNLDEDDIIYSYMGDCRHYIKGYINAGKFRKGEKTKKTEKIGDITYKYESIIVGNKEDDNNKWNVEKFKLEK